MKTSGRFLVLLLPVNFVQSPGDFPAWSLINTWWLRTHCSESKTTDSFFFLYFFHSVFSFWQHHRRQHASSCPRSARHTTVTTETLRPPVEPDDCGSLEHLSATFEKALTGDSTHSGHWSPVRQKRPGRL